MVKVKTGDLLNATEKIIGHQVNCVGPAGGLAAAVFKKYPDAKNDYYQVINRVQAAGGFGYALLGTAMLTGQQKDGHIISNIFGQLMPGADYRPEDLRSALEMLARCAKAGDWSVALPWRLSCGICGGDWTEVQQIIEETMRDIECVIYRREGDE